MAFDRVPFKAIMPKTRKLFQTSPYSKSGSGTVVYSDNEYLVLDQTLFYAESGGQEWDEGSIEGIRVIDVQDQSGWPHQVKHPLVPLPSINVDTVVVHRLERSSPFREGDTVSFNIDWDRRYRLMQQHSACHFMFLAIQELGGNGEKLPLKGCHIKTDGSRLDFSASLDASCIEEAEKFANQLIQEKLDIGMKPEPECDEIFYWNYSNQPFIPCGGTHVSNASELPFIKLRRKSQGKGVTRVICNFESCV